MNKKRIIISIAVVLTLVIAYVGVLQYRKHARKVGVSPVSSLTMGGGGMDSMMSGMVSDPATQTVTPAASQVINEVFVSEGQSVVAGDKLLAYDITSLNYTVELKNIAIQTDQIRQKQAKEELQTLKNTQPVERDVVPTPPPAPTLVLDVNPVGQTQDHQVFNYVDALSNEDLQFTKDIDDAQSAIPSSTPFTNTYEKGTKVNPYHFAISEDGFISGRFIKEFVQLAQRNNKTYYASFDIYEDNDKTHALKTSWLVSSSQLEGILATETNDLVKVDIQTHALRMIEETPLPPVIEPEGMTATELLQAIHAKEDEIRKLDIEIRRKQLELSESKSQLADGIVYAKRNGVVSGLHDKDNIPNDGTPFLTVAGGSGTEIKGSISELLLDTIHAGTMVNVVDYETGRTYQASITQIDSFPATTPQFSYGGNQNSSMYGFTAYIAEGSDLKQNTYLGLSIISEEEEGDQIYLNSAYIREDHGKKYVMKDVDGQLVKTYVTTGRVLYGMATEIKSGLSENDLIAFPYGDGAIEGARTTIDTEMNGYGG
ncbi:MAG: hypothetical protein MR283_07955 [Erysipelotrichaceae bacterium]|nr:hypothetical protein [Erysipelotrichaceae bacterium]MDY6035600.1 hypothetical protein [Bulleidia sp.]